MKRFLALLVTAVLIISMLGVMTASAATSYSISPKSVSLKAGREYSFEVTVTAYAFNFTTKVSCDGVFSGSIVQCNADGGSNGTLTGKAKIIVTVSSSAKEGDKGSINISGHGCTVDESLNPINEFPISKTYSFAVGSTSGSSGSTTNTVKAAAAPTEWDTAAANIEAMPAGGTLAVSITGDPNIPVSLLSSVKEKQGALTVSFGDYTCAIDGKSLGSMPEDIRSIDLSMKTDRDESFSAAVGGKDAYQLHFAYRGQLPGKFSYSFKADNNKPGDMLYLYYYYDRPGVCEGIQPAVVDANGYVTFEIYHCSSYFVSASVIEGAAGVDFAAESASQSLQEAQESQAELQTQLEDAQITSEELQSEINKLKSEAPSSGGNPLTASAIGPAGNLFGVPYGSLIAALLGAALLSMFLTMLICRVGIFGKKAKDKARI